MGENTTNIIIMSDDLTREDIQKLLQAIRDCEQKEFPKKELGIVALVPTLTHEECTEMLQSVKPPFPHMWGMGKK